MRAVDAYAEWDAAYVLGALSSEERREFEDHLGACPTCQAAVAEFAGMPGLLAQVSAGEVLALDDLPEEGEVPAPLPGPPTTSSSRRRARHPARHPRWRGWAFPLAAAAAALVIGAAGGYAVSSAERPAAPSGVALGSVGSARLAFSPVRPSGMTAVVDVVKQATGTQLRVECQYAGVAASAGQRSGGRDYNQAEYAIWVVDRAGHASELKAWTARVGAVMHPSGTTPLPYTSIAAVEIRQVDDGQTVMRAALT